MDIKIVKEKEPELKFKKEAEVMIHKKNYLSPKSISFSFGKKISTSVPGKETRLHPDGFSEKAVGKRSVRHNQLSDREQSIIKQSERSSAANIMDPPSQAIGRAGVSSNAASKKKYIRNKRIDAVADASKAQSQISRSVAKGVRKGGLAILNQLEGGEEVNEAFHIMSAASRPAEMLLGKRSDHKAENKLKIKQADGKITNKQFKKQLSKSKKKSSDKQRKQVRQRKMQYVINKLTGSDQQDSIGQTIKDIVKMKSSAVMLKVVKFMAALLAPLFGLLFAVAIPVILIVFIFCCSPLAAFMPGPDGMDSVREVLSGYYMEFDQTLAENNGDSGTITYLHEKDGNYVSNFMDTLMVYMVQYGTGDIGVVMDEEHRGYLKTVFDEMNSFENTSVTTTIKAGQSLGNVVTSGYCQCSICCGRWAGGPTASGVMPTADHTLAVDSRNPFVPMGTRIIMDGIEYKVEDTGPLEVNGVQFDVFIDDHATATAWGHKAFEAFLADGDENEITVTRYGSYVKNLNYEDYIKLGKLTKEEEELLREVMSEDFRSEIPSFGVGSDVANLALTKVGCRYDQDRRYEEGIYDCSSLVERCYAEFGISLPDIAADQGQYIVEHGLEVTEDMLEPGDLIFYSYKNNGRYRNISHVAIYIGNGRMVHAANPARGVVNDPFRPSNISLYGRPSQAK